ncbi:sigma-70 family RNA polymerase sigma factor [Phenylobacterium sp.]|uniref:RNA polymerase sigma factor n=1 Tax=Phenylobacterium sp. TaxID=1871053 RepID=UPI00286D2C06|nr:sigma-70 family RNA polymerase sigma factor [Phenylobacterium sp.]
MTRGDSESPGPLLEAYLRRRDDLRRYFLARLGPAADVEDLVQDLYFKVRDLPAEEILNPAAFLYRLASNLMLDRLRYRHSTGVRDAAWRRTHHVSIGAVDIVDAPDAEAEVIARQRLARLAEALTTLSPRTQRVFQLHKFDGLSHSETAARLGISRSAVEKHVSLALKHLMIRVGQ